MTVQTNTASLGIFNVDVIGAQCAGCFDNYDFDYIEKTEGKTAKEVINDGIMAVTEELLEEVISPIISCKVIAVKVLDWKRSNGIRNSIVVDITVDYDDFSELRNETVDDPKFLRYLTGVYGQSWQSGLIRLLSDDIDYFYELDLDFQFDRIINFYTNSRDNKYQYKFYNYLDEWMADNYGDYTVDIDLMDDENYLYSSNDYPIY